MNFNEPLKLGFIGGATTSAVGYAHYVSSRMDGDWQLVCGCFSTDPVINRESAKKYAVQAEHVYSDWRELLVNEKGRVDALVVLTPTPHHFEVVKACLDAKIPVICEKALTVDSHSAEELSRLCQEKNGFLAVTYNYSGYPMIRELRQLITTGVLGKLCHFQLEMPQEGFLRTNQEGQLLAPQAWRLVDGALPTLYLDLGVHLHQLAAYLLSEQPLQVVAQHGHYGKHEQVIDYVSCLAEYSGGLQGQFWFGKSALGHRNGLQLKIYGSKASVQWQQTNPEELVLSHAEGRREIIDRGQTTMVAGQGCYTRFKAGHPAGFIEAFANLYVDIAVSLRQYQQKGCWRSTEVFSAGFATEGLLFLEAVAASAREKRWVAIE